MLQVPTLNSTAIISDDAKLAAKLSCIVGKARTYTVILDGPRLQRSDRTAEVIRRHNAIARFRTDRILLAGLSNDSAAAMEDSFARQRCLRIDALEHTPHLSSEITADKRPPLLWGHNRIGIGTLRALQEGRRIEFSSAESPEDVTPSKTGHLVVCETGEDLSEVIAANYAFSLGAGLCLIPPVPNDIAAQLLDSLYSLYDDSERSPTELLSELTVRLRALCSGVIPPFQGSVTFITRRLPFGLGFPECPSTHLYLYPDLGIAIVNGLASEQPGKPGVGVAILVDPGQTPAPEVAATAKYLAERRIFIRGFSSKGATVRAISDTVHLFPYDFLMFATHCGDSQGQRWTYKYTDREGIARTLEVDVAIGVGHTNSKDLFEVIQFNRFHALDGVAWADERAKASLYIGDALQYYADHTTGDKRLEPISKVPIGRVLGSAALKMHDHNYIAVPYSLANEKTPIIVNNACVSWHGLGGRFTFAGCRAYIGTLYPVTTSEAQEVVVRLLKKSSGKYLPHALWSAQRSVYGKEARRPYVMTGVYVQRLRVTKHDGPAGILVALKKALIHWEHRSSQVSQAADGSDIQKIDTFVEYYRREVHWFISQLVRRRRDGHSDRDRRGQRR